MRLDERPFDCPSQAGERLMIAGEGQPIFEGTTITGTQLNQGAGLLMSGLQSSMCIRTT